jgi:diguanylate cyclase (GGDEF)-like protein/PAS domain S-box-containing protein
MEKVTSSLWADAAAQGQPWVASQAVLSLLQKFRLVVEHTSNMVVITDDQRRIEYVNQAYTDVTGWQLDEVRGQRPGRLTRGPLTCADTVRQVDEALIRGDSVHQIELINYKKSGQVYWVQLNIQPVRDAQGVLTHYVAIQSDVTAQRLAHEALLASERRLAEAQRLARMASFECHFDDDTMVWTPAASQVLGVSADKLPAQFMAHVDLVHADDRSALLDAYWSVTANQSSYEVEYRIQDEHQQTRWIRERGFYLPEEGGRPKRLCGLVYDITSTKAAHDRIEYLAWHDTLTGLANREHLQAHLRQHMDALRGTGGQLAVLFADLDRFKTINDSLGHHVGDEVLKTCAQRLRECVRASDTICRLGGDEFVIVLSNLEDAAAVSRIGAKLLARLSAPMQVHGRDLHITASLGVSFFPQDGETVAELMRHADAAMYQAKAKGRNTLSFYSPEINAVSAERFEIESKLRLALVRKELSLYFQPQYQAGNKQLVGFEALLRWQTVDGDWIPPDKFIPIAEETGLIHIIGQWVMAEACGHWRRWTAHGGAPVRVSVNLSAHELRDKGLLERIRVLMQQHDMPPDALEIELTESVAMHDPGASIELMKQIRALGVSLAVDDFGTGYSSLAYLKTLPIQRIKLDRSFVKDLEVDADDRAICAAAIQMAHSLGLEVVAEGVETAHQLQYLTQQGCDLMQGYHLGRPMAAQAAIELVASENN